jgi:transposase
VVGSGRTPHSSGPALGRNPRERLGLGQTVEVSGCQFPGPEIDRPTPLGSSHREAVQQMVQKVMDTNPTQYGYQAQGWTLALLRHHLKATQDSEATVRRCLQEMGYRWQRPRYVLARRDPFWRQAKGG